MKVRAARESERDEVLDLLALWYGDREFFARYNKNDPSFRDALCLVARDGEHLVSTVQIFDRAVNLGGHRVPMGGIGSVFTRQDYRHKGVASTLMRLAVETLSAEGFEVSLLFAERLTFYSQFGWRAVTRKFSVIGNAAAIESRAGFEIDTLDAGRDLEAIMSIHREYSGRYNVSAMRDESTWRANLKFAGNQPMFPGEGSEEYFALCRDAGGIRAYARVTAFHGVAMVMEYGYRAGAIDAMLALFAHLGDLALGGPSRFPTRGDHRRMSLLVSRRNDTLPGPLVTHTAHDAKLEQALAAAGSPVVYHDDNNYMWRVIAPEKLAHRFRVDSEHAAGHVFSMFEDPHSVFWTADRF